MIKQFHIPQGSWHAKMWSDYSNAPKYSRTQQKDAPGNQTPLCPASFCYHTVCCSGGTVGQLIIIQTWDGISDTPQTCDLLHLTSQEVNGTNTTSLININEIMTIKSVPMCSSNISLSSGCWGQLCFPAPLHLTSFGPWHVDRSGVSAFRGFAHTTLFLFFFSPQWHCEHWRWCHQTNEETKQTHQNRDQTDGYQRKGGGELGEKTKGIIVNNVIGLHGDRWLLDLLWWSHYKVCKCQITLLYT